MGFDEAFDTYVASNGRYDGISFAFSGADPYCGVDLDDCRDPKTGVIEAWAEAILVPLGSYGEVSPSGTGVKIFCKGHLPTDRTGTRRPYQSGEVEMYHKSRFFAVTGHRVFTTPKGVVSCQRQLDELWRMIMPRPSNKLARPALVEDSSRGAPPEIDDATILGRARRAANGIEFERLWNGRWRGRYLSQSEADLRCAACLRFGLARIPAALMACFGSRDSFVPSGIRHTTAAAKPTGRAPSRPHYPAVTRPIFSIGVA